MADSIKWIFLKENLSYFHICSWGKVFKDMHEEIDEYMNGQIFSGVAKESLAQWDLCKGEQRTFR